VASLIRFGFVSLLTLGLAVVGCSSSDDSGGGGGSGGSGQRVPLGKADNTGQCLEAPQSHCGKKSSGTCWCDEACETVGDCCADYAASCAADCTATFHWLQKDAYKDTAGRSSDAWPPHTTTTLEISCNGSVVRSAFRENHGTKPGAKDANGEVILVDVAQQEVSGPRAELEALADAYQACECGNEFLSLNGLDDPKVKQLFENLKGYLATNLTCSGPGGTAGLVDALSKGDIPTALELLPSCSWASGQDLASGFDTALEGLLATSNQELAAFHVCNNDAKLQAAQFATYAKDKKVAACDASSSLCAGPSWFYVPVP